ncbi:hypothetical protein BST95_18570 [Halioglobus japonicus]|uniref:DUF6538 domain-containing protein n=1 Tax=Halioglobus japonicus TaxID=930805 RepID=A0AAP8MB61_9GAMM|nr:hypothetical protein BST95_18570 [Halioglobus japonicus]PLW84567.1 hypothetical protein C0029_18280 [Halioglobus japonicus]GHD23034.1 hypothetical protein GCM10007052_35250 [Halioglobus japonicus]
MNNQRFLVRNRHGSTWHTRIHIPRHLQLMFSGRKEVRKSTKCEDKRQAGRVAGLWWAQYQVLFQEIEKQMSKKDVIRQ